MEMIAVLCAMFRELLAHHVDNFRRNHARFYNILRCAEINRFCLFGFVTLIGEHYFEDAFREVFVRKHFEKCESVEFRHCEVEEDYVGLESSPQALQCFIRREARLDRIAVLGKLHPVHIQKKLVVIGEKNGAFFCGCIVHTIAAAGGSSSSGTSVPAAGAGVSWSASPASKSVLKPLTSENGTFLSNAFIIASSCMVSIPCRRAAAQSLESTGLSRIIRSISEDISSTSNTARRPRSPVGHIAVRFGSYTFSGTLKRYFSGNDSSCFSMPLRCDAPSGPSPAESGLPKVPTSRCAIERMGTGGMR